MFIAGNKKKCLEFCFIKFLTITKMRLLILQKTTIHWNQKCCFKKLPMFLGSSAPSTFIFGILKTRLDIWKLFSNISIFTITWFLWMGTIKGLGCTTLTDRLSYILIFNLNKNANYLKLSFLIAMPIFNK